jgi:hypothetical protein
VVKGEMTRQKTVRESSVEMAQVMSPSIISLDENRKLMAVPKFERQLCEFILA